MSTFTLPRPLGFSLDAAAAFYADFTPGSGMAVADARQLTFAFRLDRTFEAVAVSLTQDQSRIVGTCAGTTDVDAVARQVCRMLGLDQDVAAWIAVGQRAPLVGALQAQFPGFTTAAKPSPYDAAAWG